MNSFCVKLASLEDCTGCASCMNACSKKCISMQVNKYGFLQPVIDINSCVSCRKCEKSCPIINIDKFRSNASIPPKVYSAILKDDADRFNSASGAHFMQ